METLLQTALLSGPLTGPFQEASFDAAFPVGLLTWARPTGAFSSVSPVCSPRSAVPSHSHRDSRSLLIIHSSLPFSVLLKPGSSLLLSSPHLPRTLTPTWGLHTQSSSLPTGLSVPEAPGPQGRIPSAFRGTFLSPRPSSRDSTPVPHGSAGPFSPQPFSQRLHNPLPPPGPQARHTLPVFPRHRKAQASSGPVTHPHHTSWVS